MMKRYLAIALGLCLLLSCAFPAFPVFADETEEVAEEPQRVLKLFTAADFLVFAQNCRLDSYSRGLTVELTQDIDLSGRDFSGIPIFCGTFLGNDHTLSGVNIDADGSVQGLFRYLTDTAAVKYLHVQGSIEPQGSRSTVGGIVGENAGLVEGCSFTGVISAADMVGGIAGVNTVSGIIEVCTVSGTITGSHFLGGIVGENAGVIRRCENGAAINTTPQQNQVHLADITMDTLTQSESAATVTDVGGIAGTSTGMIRQCTNRGTVGHRYMGYNIGGIVGSQSGSVLECENRGDVWGRKEVGGIVGHLEPAALIEYDEDALQILKKQLDAIGGTVNQTSANVQNTAGALSGQISQMSWAMQDAWDSVSILIPNPDNPGPPDQDTLEAARNGLSDSLWNLTGSLEGMRYVTQGSVNALSINLGTLQQQVAAMGATLGNVSENIGGTIEDVSDQDTEEDLSGKVADCVNRGNVDGDLNVGGIAGAMALESDLEGTSHMESLGERSLNFTSQIRSVIRACQNTATITAGKQNVGGIVGFQTVGLVKGSNNSGAVGSSTADYVGGIAGRSNGYIRENSVKCILTGDTCVGGVAGSAVIVTDCRTMVEIQSGREKTGAIMGISETPITEVEDPIAGNVYSVHTTDFGGIDGISYAEKAEGLSQQTFLKLEELPELFQKVTMTFVYEDGRVRTRTLTPGDPLPPDKIPAIPEKEGFDGYWEGLAETDLSNAVFDMTLHAAYTARNTVMAAQMLRGDLPILLVQGDFNADAAVSVEASAQQPPLPDDYWLAECWDVTISSARAVAGGRILIPEMEADSWHVMVRCADGSWQERTVLENGSYLVFPLDGTETAIAVTGEDAAVWYWYAAGGGILAAAAVLILLLKKRKK